MNYDAPGVSQMLPERTEIEEALCQRLARLDSELEIERADVGARGEGWRIPPVLEVTIPNCAESGTGPPPDRGLGSTVPTRRSLGTLRP